MIKGIRYSVALGGGFGLSFVGLGLLWIGISWYLPTVMFLPFLLLAFGVTRTGKPGEQGYGLVIAGAAPIGALITLFRDSNDSHLYSIIVACSWLAGILLGHYLAERQLQKPSTEGAP